MFRRGTLWVLAIGLGAASCGGGSGDRGATGGAGHGGRGRRWRRARAAAPAAAERRVPRARLAKRPRGAGARAPAPAGNGGTTGGGGAGPSGGGASGADAGAPHDAGNAGTTGSGGGGTSDAGAGPSFLPAGYTGTPFAALKIPGRINACDYDRGGAGVAWCHNTGACGSGTTTGDWYPGGSPPYRPPIPANATICSGAACADNVGVCRMSPNKPDRTSATALAPADDTYLCYSVAGEWTKYTVVVTQAGTYAVGGFMAVPQGGGVNLSFGASITTGDLALAVTNPSACGGGEYYHCWAQRENLAMVTFPAAGTYLMTLTQTGRFNADNFTFTKM